MGATRTRRFLDFPVSFPVDAWDLESNFARTLHTLLCRSNVMGRDWFDLTWFAKLGTKPNLELLMAMLEQRSPWSAPLPTVGPEWITRQLQSSVDRTDWNAVRRDVQPLLRPPHDSELRHWGVELFTDIIEKVSATMADA